MSGGLMSMVFFWGLGLGLNDAVVIIVGKGETKTLKSMKNLSTTLKTSHLQ